MCFFKRKKNEQIMISKINEIITGSGYQLVLYKKDYKHFGNCIIKFVCSGKMNIKIITDRDEIIFDSQCYPMTNLGDIRKTDRDDLVLKFIEFIFTILKSDDWRLAGKEMYLFDEFKEIDPVEYISSLEKPEMFHEHCIFCWDNIEDIKKGSCYYVLDESYWTCKNCYNDFKDILKFKVKQDK